MKLQGKVALVAGATRGAGRAIAVELGAAGATVYCTGRTTRSQQSEYNRPETIEETADLVTAAGGTGIAVPTDHLDHDAVQALAERIETEAGRLDLLVNDVWGGEQLTEWNKPVWEHDLDKGLRSLRLEVIDGTTEYNSKNYRLNPFYDLAKVAVNRMGWSHAQDLEKVGATAVSLTPGWMRSEMMLDAYQVTEENWREALQQQPHFAISETPRFTGRAVAALAADPDKARWNGQSLSSGQLAQEYDFNDVDGSRPDAWRYLVEVQDPGRPADVTGYR
jgi:NAD(P)-dependent dehydrogenase (short-subunit alcohol dehydrogenase family)